MSQLLGLTHREREVLYLVAIGYTNRQISSDLCISVNTVQNHLKRIFGKINVTCRSEAAFVYWREVRQENNKNS